LKRFIKYAIVIPIIKGDRKALFVLLSVFIFNLLGYYVAFKAIQYRIKSEVEFNIQHGLYVSDLTTITVPKSDLLSIEWEEEGKEMRYQGSLYDIVSCKISNESVTYYCLSDMEEDELEEDLEDHINRHVASNKPLKNNSEKKTLDNLTKLYFTEVEKQQWYRVYYGIKFPGLISHYLSAQIERHSIPPELA
jgi:hypothetical protein